MAVVGQPLRRLARVGVGRRRADRRPVRGVLRAGAARRPSGAPHVGRRRGDRSRPPGPAPVLTAGRGPLRGLRRPRRAAAGVPLARGVGARHRARRVGAGVAAAVRVDRHRHVVAGAQRARAGAARAPRPSHRLPRAPVLRGLRAAAVEGPPADLDELWADGGPDAPQRDRPDARLVAVALRRPSRGGAAVPVPRGARGRSPRGRHRGVRAGGVRRTVPVPARARSRRAPARGACAGAGDRGRGARPGRRDRADGGARLCRWTSSRRSGLRAVPKRLDPKPVFFGVVPHPSSSRIPPPCRGRPRGATSITSELGSGSTRGPQLQCRDGRTTSSTSPSCSPSTTRRATCSPRSTASARPSSLRVLLRDHRRRRRLDRRLHRAARARSTASASIRFAAEPGLGLGPPGRHARPPGAGSSCGPTPT